MLKTKFDERLREIPIDIQALYLARKGVETDLATALSSLEMSPTELDKMDYYRLLSRASDLERFEYKYAPALNGFERTSRFWTSVDWEKAAFLCDLKAELCRGYLEVAYGISSRFAPLLDRLENDPAALDIYRLFFYQFRGQVFAFHEDFERARADFSLALKLSVDAGKKKQIERFTYFVESVPKI